MIETEVQAGCGRTLSQTLDDVREQAIERLMCEGVDLERMSTWFSRDGSVSSGLMVDGQRVATVRTEVPARVPHTVIVSVEWHAPFEHLNAR